MLFNSFAFLWFFVAVLVVYWCLPRNHRWKFLLAASAYFYINWQPIYFFLLLITTVTTYFSAKGCSNLQFSKRKRKLILAAGCAVPLLALLLFKYYNFITETTCKLLEMGGVNLSFPKLDLLLPIGISFYTFTAVGYLIDVYKKKYEPEGNFALTALFISFFAQISSGPIPRGNLLMPQLLAPAPLTYDRFMHGFRTFLWGLFMKLCVADRLAVYVDAVYGNLGYHSGTTIFLASLLYTFQIYCDFGGYSLMALGTARMLGIELTENFRRPYFATSFKDFWGRWHISLSTWFRDYVYIPLGGSRVGRWRHKFNLIVTFLLSGLWHGASLNFILWGGMHGTLQAAEGKKKPNAKQRRFISTFALTAVKMALVFICVNFAWVFFRLIDETGGITAISRIFTASGVLFIDIALVYGGVALMLLLCKDFIDEYFPKIRLMSSRNFFVSNVATAFLIAFIMFFGVFDSSSFIYSQF